MLSPENTNGVQCLSATCAGTEKIVVLEGSLIRKQEALLLEIRHLPCGRASDTLTCPPKKKFMLHVGSEWNLPNESQVTQSENSARCYQTREGTRELFWTASYLRVACLMETCDKEDGKFKRSNSDIII